MKKIQKFKSTDDLRKVLATQYQKQIQNIFGDRQAALEFLSNVVVSVQRQPKLLECTPDTLLSAFVTIAQLKFMPSDVSGEAYVIPYKNKAGLLEAKFQMGYQGFITLLYRAGITGLGAEIVRDKDDPKMENGQFTFSIDPKKSEKERGKPIGVYAWAVYNGGKIEKFMNLKDIEEHGRKFSKSYGSTHSPWKQAPEWMWKKTVIIQLAKLLPKNDILNRAMRLDQEGDTKLDFRNGGGIIKVDEIKDKSGLTLESQKNENNTEKEENIPNPFVDGGGEETAIEA